MHNIPFHKKDHLKGGRVCRQNHYLENDPLTFNAISSAKPPTLRLLYSRKHPDLTSSRDICLIQKADEKYRPVKIKFFDSGVGELQQPNAVSLAYVSATCKRKFNSDMIFMGIVKKIYIQNIF
nr:MAG TPA: hypothetical protein [Caudoviricetes sp.]